MTKGCSCIGLAVWLALAVGALAGFAQAQSPADARSVYDRERLDDLYRQLRHAPNAAQAQRLNNEIWRLWTEGPDERAGAQSQRILGYRRTRQLDRALNIANELTERLPNYAEGWNQKATILFEMGRLDQSLETIDKVLALEPKHFGALSGQAMILLREGRVKVAQQVLRRAIEIHPFLAERRFLIEQPGDPI